MSRKSRIEMHAARAFGLKDYARALHHLEELLEIVGENPQTLHMIAVCHARRNADREALAFAVRALDADPGHVASLKLAAEIHFLRGEREQARRFARRVLEAMPSGRAAKPYRPWQAFMHRIRVAYSRNDTRERSAFDSREHAEWLAWARTFVGNGPPGGDLED